MYQLMIRPTVSALRIFVLLFGSSVGAQTHPGLTFDETVRSNRSLNSSGETKPAVMHITASRGNLRIDIDGKLPGAQNLPSRDSSVMLLTDSGTKLTLLNVQEKHYLTLNPMEMMQGVTKMLSGMGGSIAVDSDATKLRLDSLGPGPTIDGHPTLRYRLMTMMRISVSMMGNTNTMEGEFVEDIQAATDLANLPELQDRLNLFSSMSQSLGIAPEYVQRLADLRKKIRGFPIRVTKVQTMKTNGRTRSSSEDVELSNIRQVAVPDSVFAIPAGYTPGSFPKKPTTVNQ